MQDYRFSYIMEWRWPNIDSIIAIAIKFMVTI